jgi:hypothetical protein
LHVVIEEFYSVPRRTDKVIRVISTVITNQLQQEPLEMSTLNVKYCSINDILVTFEIYLSHLRNIKPPWNAEQRYYYSFNIMIS